MKIKKMLSMAVVLLLAAGAAWAVVVTDDFSTDHNYLVDGTAGTVWDGLAYNDGLSGTQDTVVTAAAATGGGLNMQSSNGSMEHGDDDGMYLYINVPAGGDFVANVFIRDYTYINYHDIGLIAIVPGTQDYVLARHFDQWGVANRLRSTDGGDTNNDFSPHPDGITPYLQLEKAGAVFTLRVSFDAGVTYEEVNTVERLDMENAPLRVGLYQCTFVPNTGNVTFDDFSLEFASNIANGPDPKNGETLVQTTTQLTWQAPDNYTPTGYNVYIGTDPNVNGASELGWSGTTIDPASDMAYALSHGTAYYWRVDSIDPNDGGPVVYAGDVWSFETAPTTPLVTVDPVSQTVAAGTTIDLSVTALNTTSYEWFRSDDAVVGGDVSVGTGNPLSVAINGIAEEGWYYCVATGAGSDTSGLARIMSGRLVGWWPLDGDLADAVTTVVAGAPTHDGTAEAPNHFTGGMIGQGYQFLGDGQVVTVVDSADYFNFYSSGMTVSCWAQIPAGGRWDTLVSKEKDREAGAPGPWKGWFLARSQGDDRAVFGIRPFESRGVTVVDTDWHLFIGVYDPEAQELRVYLDGVLDETVEADDAGFAGPNTAPLIFGAESTDGTVWPSQAVVDDVKIWNYPLDSYEIAQLYVDVAGGAICVEHPLGDLNDDCVITLEDLALIGVNWLSSGIVD